jgi:GNAT superfamily N-acetyltransferase
MMLHLIRTTSDNTDFQNLVKRLDKELWERYDQAQAAYAVHNKIERNSTVVVGYWHKAPVGCGCFKALDDSTAEIKRMFVAPEERSKGIASGILKELCIWADQAGFKRVILETGIKQPEAIRLYTKAGFEVIANYPPYIGMEYSVCMEKRLR